MQAAIGRTHARHDAFIGSDTARKRRITERCRALEYARRVIDLKRRRAQRQTMRMKELARKRIGLGIEHDRCITLPEQRHILRAMLARGMKTRFGKALRKTRRARR